MSKESFSNRHGYKKSSDVEITVRQDAPHELRGVIIDLAYECEFSPDTLRTIICQTLRKRPDRNNWSDYPNIDDENHFLIDGCEWYKVYDIVETIYKKMKERYFIKLDYFENEINEYFVESGIGWILKNGLIEYRGSEDYETIIKTTEQVLSESEKNTAKKELHEAIVDISRRPKPDITGAIQHSMASLECVAREVCGNQRATLGEILKRYKNLIPPPLDTAIIKAWGYASENARHIQEGREPSYDEAALILGICASVSTYLSNKGRA